jgi:hypothetical protein
MADGIVTEVVASLWADVSTVMAEVNEVDKGIVRRNVAE